MKYNINNKMVHVRTFTFGDKSKKYPYPMIREIDFKEFIKKLKEKVRIQEKNRNVSLYYIQEEIDKLNKQD